MTKTRRKEVQRKRYPDKKRKAANGKEEVFFVRVCVSLIMILVVFALNKTDTPKINEIREKLRFAITDTISLDEVKETFEKGAEILYTFKENKGKENALLPEEGFLFPEDAAKPN